MKARKTSRRNGAEYTNADTYLFRLMIDEEGICDTKFHAGLLDEMHLAFSAEPPC